MHKAQNDGNINKNNFLFDIPASPAMAVPSSNSQHNLSMVPTQNSWRKAPVTAQMKSSSHFENEVRCDRSFTTTDPPFTNAVHTGVSDAANRVCSAHRKSVLSTRRKDTGSNDESWVAGFRTERVSRVRHFKVRVHLEIHVRWRWHLRMGASPAAHRSARLYTHNSGATRAYLEVRMKAALPVRAAIHLAKSDEYDHELHTTLKYVHGYNVDYP